MAKSVLAGLKDEMFAKARIRIEFNDRVLAGIPSHGAPLDYFIKSKTMSEAEAEDFKARVQAGKLTNDELDELKATSICVFERNANGELCVWHNNFKAMIREIMTTFGFNSIKPIRTKGNECAGGKQTFQHAIQVTALDGCNAIPYLKDGKPVKESDGSVDRVKHIADAAGRRSAIGRHEYMEAPVAMEFLISWPRKGSISEDNLREIFCAAEQDGLGACRSQGFGSFVVTEWKTLVAYEDPRQQQEE